MKDYNPTQAYDLIRCRACGHPWDGHDVSSLGCKRVRPEPFAITDAQWQAIRINLGNVAATRPIAYAGNGQKS